MHFTSDFDRSLIRIGQTRDLLAYFAHPIRHCLRNTICGIAQLFGKGLGSCLIYPRAQCEQMYSFFQTTRQYGDLSP